MKRRVLISLAGLVLAAGVRASTYQSLEMPPWTS
jgi:hypothetical protein